MRRTGRLIVATMACTAVLWSGFAATATAEPATSPVACNTPLAAGDIATITTLSDNATLRSSDPL
ncbi:hypothetical protein [Antrihabitans cavernicola]|uniref:Uncharacterized protein n=1 Tax=Antrihabitans cavernicola TaxID=2495913 RepID=A0A5A7S9K5_9NOCA|nr:hypothetical protein [Spelaeibacter cavernicola]KAA0020132.1 hypothetical protein FOY51_21260 [Spelaeibacter cavernicola]